MVGFLATFLIALAVTTVGYLLKPSIKTNKPAAATDLEDPTSDAGREFPVLFGDMTIKSGNILYYGEKSTRQYKVKA